ncbi:pyruvate, orthophosphate dikinase [Nocardiopsis flavescens]|uniref:Pyruvate, orthophosphate dikinase n=1 Tax=Nocardiopsis flavescens TaxID=758803 RepID=A0A1M6JMV7_9ACTN|nr:pyruvate, orthophosphate dikinase [Nocardiopsis flavescens]
MVSLVRPLGPDLAEGPATIGGKAHGLVLLHRLGLAVPPGFVITTAACRAYRRDGRPPEELEAEVDTALAALERRTGRTLGGDPALTVSVRSGAAVSMPGMMTTVLGLGAPPGDGPAAGRAAARERLTEAVTAVLASWDAPRARTYRALHGLDDGAGTAVVVQAMVDGDRDDRSASGVAFDRDPVDGSPGPGGDVLFRSRGDAVVSGRALPLPLSALADREPGAWADLERALGRVRDHYRDACYLEFTVESGRLWLLQVRRAGFTGTAAVRTAVDLARAGVLERAEALARVTPDDLERARRPVMAATAALWTRGTGAGPGVAAGRIATDSAAAVRLSASGPVVLVRPETSPADMAGIAAAAGVLTARGGASSHAAVVARSLGRPAVVGAADLHVEPGRVRAGERWAAEGDLLTLDGTTGRVALGVHPAVAPPADAAVRTLLSWADAVTGGAGDGVGDAERLAAARRLLGA